jgi:hypothetical protein
MTEILSKYCQLFILKRLLIISVAGGMLAMSILAEKVSFLQPMLCDRSRFSFRFASSFS